MDGLLKASHKSWQQLSGVAKRELVILQLSSRGAGDGS